MLKTSKSVLGFLLVFYMVVTSMPCVQAEIIGEFDSLQYKEYADYIEITGCVDSPLRIVIPENIQGKPVKSIGAWAFSDCTELTDISIPDTVTSVGAKAFYGTSCYNDESNWTDGVLYIDNYLIQADSSKIPPTYVIKDGTRCIANYAFQECRTLENVIIPGSVAFIGEDAFRDCRNLIGVTLSDGIKSIGDYSFFCCNNLAEIFIPKSVENIGESVFRFCYDLKSIIVDPENESYYSEDNVLFNKERTILIKYCAGKTEESYSIPNSVKSIDNDAFSYCFNLSDIILPDSLINIGDFAFERCRALSSITLPNGVINIGKQAFCECGFTEITLPDSVRNIGTEAFNQCRKLTNIISSGNMERVGRWAFSDTEYYYDESNWTDGALYIGNCLIEVKRDLSGNYCIRPQTKALADYALFCCSKLASVSIPSSVTSIGACAFYCCSGLADIKLPNDLTYIDESAFFRCDGLTSITIPNGVTCIEKSTFYDCENLEDVIILNGTKEIGKDSFSWCKNLKSITIPASVTSIDNNAFYYSGRLSDIYYGGSEEDWKNAYRGEWYDTTTVHFNCAPPYIKTIVTDNEAGKTITVETLGITNGSKIILVFYDKDERPIEIQMKELNTETLIFSIDKAYNSYKAMAWENFDSMYPLCKAGVNQ